MLLDYIQAAMRGAKYELLSESPKYYGEIASCNGVWANAETLEECRRQLQQVLEDWILLRVHRNLTLPEIDGLSIGVRDVA